VGACVALSALALAACSSGGEGNINTAAVRKVGSTTTTTVAVSAPSSTTTTTLPPATTTTQPAEVPTTSVTTTTQGVESGVQPPGTALQPGPNPIPAGVGTTTTVPCIVVPNVANGFDTYVTAYNILSNMGLKPWSASVPAPEPDALVVSQLPEAGTCVSANTSVQLDAPGP
jgi:hypothetical protein